MSKMSNLDLVLDEMITAGQKMIDAATALKEMFSETSPEMSKVETKASPTTVVKCKIVRKNIGIKFWSNSNDPRNSAVIQWCSLSRD